ncbi:class I poly(R)-hydroxyalkanoic acid synthase [Methylopila turkensis]|uniref:Class I poly(R)-hydroxyalkanoic acid synthase n=1 Tax=Methylopila turkensis TaxID=1437816 RepID=A0A9W6JR50_9HYPH|nr:class I poly(R)-hydroxyalkanoic acid synthase [Methylopila turkensis]GLK80849.1 class I poly(R)-hydroxyalkanoic acid synthase [Methylopila turkensis]
MRTSKAEAPPPPAEPRAPDEAAPKPAAASGTRRPAAAKPKTQGARPAKSAPARETARDPAKAPKPKRRAPKTAQAAEPRPAQAPRSSSSAGGAEAPDANPFLTADVETFAANMARLYEEGGRAMSAYMRPRESGERPFAATDEIVDVVKTIGQVAERWMADPSRTVEAQKAFTTGFLDLWTGTLRRFSGEQAPPTAAPDPKDARFRDPEWSQNPFFDFLKQAYLHSARWAERMVDEAHELDPHTRQKAAFYVRQIANAVSPSNFVPTNPELLRETFAQKGENLVRGMQMLAEDIAAGNGDLRIRQTDNANFEVGRNLATTPGKVIFRNELMELIQYAPTTAMTRTRPVLIVPPWINKFYILDLTPEKSFIKWCVDQGLTVFCVSWVNPDARHAAKSFDDYMRDGVMTAVDVARAATGAEQVDAVGYCVGGTLLAVTLAYMAARDDQRIASATFLTTQVDFTHAGDLKVFVDEAQVAAVEAKMAAFGFLEGSSMANAFNMLRSNDLIWPYVVNNYMKGKAPFPFDLLYWNSDTTRMPAANHSFYLRGCYLNNDLAQGRMEIAGEVLDLGKVKVPVYELATREDHIAPARSAFLGATMFGGPVRFVLAGSGHIAGVVNPPAKMKYQHWVGEEPAGAFEDWFAKAEERPGSWWPDWRAWLAASDATAVPARVPGEGPYPAIDDAPGAYVKVRV